MNIGQAIKTLRTKKKYSQGEFAELCDLSQTALSQIESGKKHPHNSTLEVIASKLEIPVVALYFLSIDEKDIPENKKEQYKAIGPVIKEFMLSLIEDEGNPVGLA